VLIEAVAQLTAWKLNVQVALVGDGRLRTEFEGLSRSRGVNHCVEFLGHVPPGQPVRSHLDRADVFVLPSRTEGLPRALIEAMARGLPCVGSRVGGIPELLDETELVPPDNAAQLAETLRDLILDPARRARLAEANLRKARAFHVDIMRARRREFYFAVRDETQAWIRSRSQHRADAPT
jgi:glycosyltransferase involved in cell wall biosynthesis